MKTHASGAVPPMTAALNAVRPVRCSRSEGSAWRPRESPRTRICGLRFRCAIRSSLIERSVGGLEAAVAVATARPASTSRSGSARRGRTSLISESEVEEGVGLGDGHDGYGRSDPDRDSLPDTRPEPDLPRVRREVYEHEQAGEEQLEPERQ